jgi:hypothetical protein
MTITLYSVSKQLRELTKSLIHYSGEFNTLIGRVDTLRMQVEEQFQNEIKKQGYEEFARCMEIETTGPGYSRRDTQDERDAALEKIFELQRQLTTLKPKENEDA